MTLVNPVFRPNGISYLRIPAIDAAKSAAFYHKVFSWKVREDPQTPSFEDGTGHVIGHWKTDIPVVGEAGVIPYIYVNSVRNVMEKIRTQGGTIVREPYQEGELWVAKFRDPAGNVFGIWQNGPL
jgi:predicted enzyme related to lactoylglutathione lyase